MKAKVSSFTLRTHDIGQAITERHGNCTCRPVTLVVFEVGETILIPVCKDVHKATGDAAGTDTTTFPG